MATRQMDRIEVLLVEDDEEDYLLTKDLLSSPEGPRHEIHWVSDYRAALEAVDADDYDVCLVDYRLGAENGIELVRELVSNGHEMPIIVLTGHSDRDIDFEAARSGAADYLVKGEVSPALLERTIRYAMQSHADLQALREKEDKLQKLNDALEQRVDERTVELRAVLDATVDAIHMADLEGTTLVANSALGRLANELFGLSSADALHAGLSEHTSDPEIHRAATEAIAADPECERWDEYELPASGRVLRRYTAPVWDSAGSRIGRIFFFREVTAEREAERLRAELVATVSHELRTPLGNVLGFAELLSLRAFDPETQTRYLGLIHSEAQRLTALINDLLDLQRIEEGGFALTLEPFDLATLLREQTAVFAGQSERHTLEVNLPDEALEVLGERDRVAQVLANLLTNAIKYSPEGGPVELAAERTNGEVRVAVTDHGLGIPEDQQQRIFTKFFRVHSSETSEIGGTGLGLAVCRELVEAHGGRIGLESAHGKGSTFWFELPATLPSHRGG